jgi:hypothetical protein
MGRRTTAVRTNPGWVVDVVEALVEADEGVVGQVFGHGLRAHQQEGQPGDRQQVLAVHAVEAGHLGRARDRHAEPRPQRRGVVLMVD